MQTPGITLYPRVVFGTFVSRPNRFVAFVEVDGSQVVCHVKNTGRLKELLLPGARVVLAVADNEQRKTAFDLVAVYKGDMLVNVDSQAPNKVAFEWLKARHPLADIRREAPWKDSRLDFHVRSEGFSLYVEVKGCTLAEGGLALFPDAPTLRGVKHLSALKHCVGEGHSALALFVVQMHPVHAFSPHDAMHPAFGVALRAAAAAGVQVMAVDCAVTPQAMNARGEIPVIL